MAEGGAYRLAGQSHLRLARVLVLRNKPDPEYHAFFAAWKSADTDLPLPIQARREFAAIATGDP